MTNNSNNSGDFLFLNETEDSVGRLVLCVRNTNVVVSSNRQIFNLKSISAGDVVLVVKKLSDLQYKKQLSYHETENFLAFYDNVLCYIEGKDFIPIEKNNIFKNMTYMLVGKFTKPDVVFKQLIKINGGFIENKSMENVDCVIFGNQARLAGVTKMLKTAKQTGKQIITEKQFYKILSNK